MPREIRTTPRQREQAGRELRTTSVGDRIEHVNNRVDRIYTHLRKIFSIWDGFFKTVGVAIGIALEIFVIWLTRSWYYTNGKWSFGTVFFGGVVFVIVLIAIVWGVFKATNALLINRVECQRE